MVLCEVHVGIGMSLVVLVWVGRGMWRLSSVVDRDGYIEDRKGVR